MGHFTQAKIEAVVNESVTKWGTHPIRVRLTWGYDKPLEATVVALELPNKSRLAYHHQTTGDVVDKKPGMVRKKSPPLGIPLASLVEMKDEYKQTVSDIVTGDLDNYIDTAYYFEKSELPKRLLQIICSFYSAGLAANQEVCLPSFNFSFRQG